MAVRWKPIYIGSVEEEILPKKLASALYVPIS